MTVSTIASSKSKTRAGRRKKRPRRASPHESSQTRKGRHQRPGFARQHLCVPELGRRASGLRRRIQSPPPTANSRRTLVMKTSPHHPDARNIPGSQPRNRGRER